MKSFELYEPTTVQQAVGLLDQFGATGKALGGGSDLIGGIMKDWVQGKGQPLPVQIVDLTTMRVTHTYDVAASPDVLAYDHAGIAVQPTW